MFYRANVVGEHWDAQRRPARPSRQLGFGSSCSVIAATRSTKAGSAEPATPDLRRITIDTVSRAQRRPARPSRQLRTTRSGTERMQRHAQRRPARPSRQLTQTQKRTQCKYGTLNEGRLGRAGNSSRRDRARCGSRTLNEGRLGRAGNSGTAGDMLLVDWIAQRRPARPSRQLRRRRAEAVPQRPTLNEGRLGRAGNSRGCRADRRGDIRRSTKAGSAEPATLDDASEARRIIRCRSTKAGSAEPATRSSLAAFHDAARRAQRRPARPSRQLPWVSSGSPRRQPALNEGRLGRAGNSPRKGRRRRLSASLNEGRLGRAGNSCGWADQTPQHWHAQRRPARPSRQLVRRRTT